MAGAEDEAEIPPTFRSVELPAADASAYPDHRITEAEALEGASRQAAAEPSRPGGHASWCTWQRDDGACDCGERTYRATRAC